MRAVGPRSGVLLAALVLLAWPPAAMARTPVGAVSSTRLESPHPHPSGDATRPVVWSRVLHHPGATFLKLHVGQLDLAAGGLVRILDGQGRVVAEYTEWDSGRPAFWAPSAIGDTAVVELRASAGGGAGVTIDRYGHGNVPLVSMSVCGSDQTEDVACYSGTPIEAASRAVGHMVFQDHGMLFSCTGFLISAEDHFLTNSHCISTQAAVSSLEVRFDYQRGSCGGDEIAPFETFVGDRLLRADPQLDVAVVSLAGRPSARYGFLPLSRRQPALDEPLYVPQHPLGGVKRVSVAGCRVSTPEVDGDVPGSDFGHQCDTQPGSSGSPVLDLDNQVVGLHHVGGCVGSAGENRAVLMSRILTDSMLTLKGAKLVPQSGFLTLHAVLALGLGSDGVSPLTEAVTLTLADADGAFYSATLPPGAFRRQGADFLFSDPKGTVAGGLRSLRLQPGADTVDVLATARAANLTGADREDITITVGIGDDVGGRTVTFRRRPTTLQFP